jgi:predicted glycoside hydrolase/deacetylase ChbG (UPF0249 family)
MKMLNKPDFLKECVREAREQIEIFLSYGLIPTHIDTHHHVHGFSSIFEILLELSSLYDIPAMRFSRQGYRLPTREDIPFDDKLYGRMEEMLRQKGICFSSHLLEGARKIDDIGPDITELIVHPSLEGEAWRMEELEILRSKSGYEVLERYGVRLISFKDLTDCV